MAEIENGGGGNEDRKKNTRNRKKIILIITPIISIVLAAACFIVIIQGILDVITNIVNNIMDFINDPGSAAVRIWKGASNTASFIFNTGEYQAPESSGFTIILEDETVKEIKNQITSQAIDTNATGLTDVAIKKMILVNYMTSCTVDTEIGLPLSDEELEIIVEDLKKKGITFEPKVEANGIFVSNIHAECNDGVFHYWSGDGEEHGEAGKWYMSAKGIVNFMDENGQRIYPYNNNPNERNKDSLSNFEIIAQDCKGAYESNKNTYGDAARNVMQCAYTITNLGSIQMNRVKNIEENTKYIYAGQEFINEDKAGKVEIEQLTLEYAQYISQYTMPMDFLVSLLELTASNDFIEAICDLVGESRIDIVIASNNVYTSDINTTKYKDDVTVEGVQELQTKTVTKTTNNDGDTTTENTETNSYQVVSVTATSSETSRNGEDYNVKKEIIETTKSNDYSLYVKSVKTWYCKAEYDINSRIRVKYTTVGEDENEISYEEEYNGVGNDVIYNLENLRGVNDKIEQYRVWILDNDKKDEKRYATEYEYALDRNAVDSLVNRTSNKYELFRAKILSDVCNNKNFFRAENLKPVVTENNSDNLNNSVNINENADNNNNSNVEITENTVYTPSRVTKIIENMTNLQNSEVHVTVEKVVDKATTTTNYEDNTDKFLGLLKNQTGTYVKGATFKSDGRKVKYNDLYNGNAVVGDLLVNGADALFQFMESTSSYNKGLENIMKYILYRYSNEDFGVTNFDDAINWLMQSTNFYSASGKSIISEFLASWENTPMWNYKNGKTSNYNSNEYIYKCITEDKKYYIMQDDLNTGNNNRNYGFGVCFYKGEVKEFQNTEYFIDEGIHVTDAKYNKYGQSKIEVEIVDRIKEKIIADKRKEVENLVKSKGLTLEEHQIHALMAARYQGWTIGDFLDAYKANGCKIDESLRNYCKGMGTSTDRYNANWKLFSEGKYIAGDGSELNPNLYGGSILQVAESIHKYMEDNKYSYCILGGESNSHSGSCGLDSTFEESKTNHHLTCCATFVSWVLRDAGYMNETIHGAISLANALENKYNFTRVSISELKPGDIIYYNYGHIEIYAGDGQIYNAGSVNSIQKDSPYSTTYYYSATYGLRPPNK